MLLAFLMKKRHLQRFYVNMRTVCFRLFLFDEQSLCFHSKKKKKKFRLQKTPILQLDCVLVFSLYLNDELLVNLKLEENNVWTWTIISLYTHWLDRKRGRQIWNNMSNGLTWSNLFVTILKKKKERKKRIT